MKHTVIAKNKKHLKELIEKEILENGNQCDLNYIDISNLKDISAIFYRSDFNGDISKWNTSNIKNMNGLFRSSKFNGDISTWNTSKVKLMVGLFDKSDFNGDISKWDVSNVVSLFSAFYQSKFSGDLSKWKPYNLKETLNIFYKSNCEIPYWANYNNKENRKKAIDSYYLQKELAKELNGNIEIEKKIKL